MENVLVTGGTGNLGKSLVEVLKHHGVPFVVATRANKDNAASKVTVDLQRNTGVADAVKDKSIIFHLATDMKKDIVLTENLLKAIGNNKNIHLVYSSIVGIDQSSFGYFQQKLASEHLIKQSGIPFTILRATQFHEFIDQIFSRMLKFPIGLLPKKVLIQPIGTKTVAEKLYQLALLPPANKIFEIGGLKPYTVQSLANAWRMKTGKKRWVINMPLFGKMKREFTDGSLLTDQVERPGQSWEEYLEEKYS